MLKIQKDLENTTNPAIVNIANELITRSESDPLLINTLNKENKSLTEMFAYITGEARKRAVDNVAYIAPDEVYGMAIHYYDEDDIMGKRELNKKTKPKVKKDIELPEEDEDAFNF